VVATVIDPVSSFLEAASVPLDAWHASGGLEDAQRLLQENPDLATRDIFAAATLGDATLVQVMIDKDPSCAVKKGGPRDWEPIVYLCFSRYLKLDRSRSDGFVKSARALLRAGASVGAGWYDHTHIPPEWESLLYGACGIAHNPDLTALLLEFGADPNDGETCYHAPETFDNRALKVLVLSGKLTQENLALLLMRKLDWHDKSGAIWLLENGASPNFAWKGRSAFLHAIRRDCDLETLEAIVTHGGDPNLAFGGVTPMELAARRGRGVALEMFAKHGHKIELKGVDALAAACAVNDEPTVRELGLTNPQLIEDLRQHGGTLLAEFAGNGNATGVRLLLETGAPVWSVYKEGDLYYGITENSTALHVAAWRIRPETVKVLISRGSDVNALDGRGQTPLQLAIKACTESYWTERKTPECARLLLEAGAKLDGIRGLTGYEELDQVLVEHGFEPFGMI